MTRRQALAAHAALLVGALALVASFVRPTSGQPGPVPPPAVGRYAVASSGNANGIHVVVTDTVTGQSWWRNISPSVDNQWTGLGTPVPAK